MPNFLPGELFVKLAISILLVLMLYGIGIFVYTHVEGWSVIDTVYFITVTIATIGYGDFVPHTDTGKIFTIFMIWVGVSIALFAMYSIAEAREKMVDTHLLQRLRTLKHLANTHGVKRDWPEPDVQISENEIKKKYFP